MPQPGKFTLHGPHIVALHPGGQVTPQGHISGQHDNRLPVNVDGGTTGGQLVARLAVGGRHCAGSPEYKQPLVSDLRPGRKPPFTIEHLTGHSHITHRARRFQARWHRLRQ
jgi:hypothetical protein